jgi:transposase
VEFIQETLKQYPRLRSTRIFQMIRDRGYEGGSSQLRRLIAQLRPVVREPFLQLRTFPGEQAQADWAHFGAIQIGQARRLLSFLLTLLLALALSFFFDQSLENFLSAHVEAFHQFHGCSRVISRQPAQCRLARRGDVIQFHAFVGTGAHYHFAPRPARAPGNEKDGWRESLVTSVRSLLRDVHDVGRPSPNQIWRGEVPISALAAG